MNDKNPSCANCGAPLRTTDSVCKPCEHEFLQSLDSPHKGKYRCPGCSFRFDKPTLDWMPHDAPWYRFQTQKHRCPHCRVLLRDRKEPPSPSRRSTVLAGLFIVMMALSMMQSGKAVKIGIAVALLFLWVVELVQRWRARALVGAEEERYATEEPAA